MNEQTMRLEGFWSRVTTCSGKMATHSGIMNTDFEKIEKSVHLQSE